MGIQSLILDDNILNIYKFGSHVYGTNNVDSDDDYIIITDNKVISDDINIHFYTESEFNTLVLNCDIQAMECLFLDKSHILKKCIDYDIKIDLTKLRESISTVSNTSYVKAKKKLTVMADYDKKLALKSLFHSLRILDFGIQLARDGKIYNYSSMNYVYDDVMKTGGLYDYSDLWDKLDAKYRKIFNKLKSTFKTYAPKFTENDIEESVGGVLTKHGVSIETISNTSIVTDLIALFNQRY